MSDTTRYYNPATNTHEVVQGSNGKLSTTNVYEAKGSEFITDTEQHTATDVFVALQLVTDTVISAYSTEVSSEITGNPLTGVVLSAGIVIYGRFKTVTLTSGKVLAYKGI
jgi:hypothetical protein